VSKLPFELFLALRYLRPKRTFVSVITLISIVGVMLGVAVLIVVISVMSGFDRQLREKILGFNSHLTVRRDGLMHDYESVAKVIAANPQVKAVTPFVIGRVMLETQPDSENSMIEAPYVRGIVPRLEKDVSRLLSSIVVGTNSVTGKGLLVGSSLASRLRLHPGDKVAILSPRAFKEWRQASKAGQEEAPMAEDYEVKGIFDVGYYEFNDQFVVCSLPNAQDLYGIEEAVHGLLVMVHDPERAFQVKRQLEEVLDPDFEVTTWMEDNSSILEALLVEKNVMYYLLFFIVIVAAFGITSALITFVVQKTREIGMLKALGATSQQVMWLFMSQSLVVGVIGVIAGFGLGMLAVSYRNEFLRFMRQATGFELFPASIYNFPELPALIVPGDITVICGGSLIICLLAGLLPAWNAGRLKPVEALRYE
jgi:lipoprotein-releasing system permease protein